MLLLAAQSVVYAWQPQGDKIKTRWAKDVTPENVWASYPRPQLQREAWVNLNGLWSYEVTDQQTDKKNVKYSEGEILVPFSIESSLSGVQRTFLPTDKLWYKREFTIPSNWKRQDVILHFGAVDYEANLWINGKKVGSHKGGNNPFQFNITKYLKRSGVQTIELSVVDPTDTESISRGKQQLNQQGIWYTPVSGIWQTVWMEAVGDTYIEQVLPTADIDDMEVELDFDLEGAKGNEDVVIEVLDGDKVIKTIKQELEDDVIVDMEGATLWSPTSPKLYNINVTLLRKGKELDKVKSYFAMRKVESKKDECGYNRVFLNNEPIFQFGTLDQGWWPDGLLTPPSEEAMLWDMVQLKEMGFNTIRKHIKVEPEQYYYYADSLGIMMWQDMVSGFATTRSGDEHVAPHDRDDWNAPAAHSAQWQGEMFEMIDRLRFYSSITTWVVFNEGWGQHNTVEIVNKVMDYDESRVINGVTGWTDRGVGDMYDVHNYPVTSMIIPDYNGDRISVLGEFGGYGWAIDGHLWNASKRNWGYKNIEGAMALMENYGRLLYDLKNLIAQGLSAAIYTQTTDVEGEVNGLMTYDREVVKIPKNLLHLMQSELYKVKSAKVETLINCSQSGGTNTRKVSLNGGEFKNVVLPFAVEPKTNVISETTFTADKDYENLSLWLNVFGDVRVWLNGVEVFNQNVKPTRHHNHYSLSDYSKYLNKGENNFKIEVIGGGKVDFDYGLRAF